MIDFKAYQPHVLSAGCPGCGVNLPPQFCEKHWEQWKAARNIRSLINRMVSLAVRLGEIPRPDECNRCHKERDLVAHHNDYNKPFDIEWLCHSCHGVHHAPDHNEARKAAHIRKKAKQAAELAARQAAA